MTKRIKKRYPSKKKNTVVTTTLSRMKKFHNIQIDKTQKVIRMSNHRNKKMKLKARMKVSSNQSLRRWKSSFRYTLIKTQIMKKKTLKRMKINKMIKWRFKYLWKSSKSKMSLKQRALLRKKTKMKIKRTKNMEKVIQASMTVNGHLVRLNVIKMVNNRIK